MLLKVQVCIRLFDIFGINYFVDNPTHQQLLYTYKVHMFRVLHSETKRDRKIISSVYMCITLNPRSHSQLCGSGYNQSCTCMQ